MKPRRTKAKGKGGTAKVVKSKKALRELAKRVSIKENETVYMYMLNQLLKFFLYFSFLFQETIQAMRDANVLIDMKKKKEIDEKKEPRKSYGVLDRFLPKTK